MSLPDAVSRRVTTLLREYFGAQVHIDHSEPIGEGWSAQFGAWPWITRCAIADDTGAAGSVIVKLRRPESHSRSAPQGLRNERAALEFLTSIGGAFGPRLLAADDGMLIMEDLGAGPALEDLLVGSDAVAAEDGLVAFAIALGRLHAITMGHAEEFYALRRRLGPVDPAYDRPSILGDDLGRSWSRLRQIVAERPYLPATNRAGPDVDELMRVLSEPGGYLAFSQGDTCPQNCRIVDGGVRFVDFEDAAFQHALLDAAALRFPFPACPCWSRLPQEVSRRAEGAYRQELARSCPDVLDQASYEHGLAAACAAWAIVRMVRLPKLENVDAAHPMRFSRRGQLLDTIAIAVSCAQESGSLPCLASWLADAGDALRRRWPHISSTQPCYPAFQSR